MKIAELKYKAFLLFNAGAFFFVPLNGSIPAFISLELSHINFLSVAIGALFLLSFFQDDFQPARPFKNAVSLSFFVLYALYLLSGFISTNHPEAMRAIEHKMALFFIPYIFFSNPAFYKQHKTFLATSLSAGLIFIFIVLDIKAVILWLDGFYFPDYIAYTNALHPTYLSISVFFVMLLCFKKPVESSFVMNKENIAFLILAAVLFLHLFVIQSRSVLLCLVFVAIYAAYKAFFEKRKSLLLVFFVLLLAAGYFMRDSRVAGRIGEVFNTNSSVSDSGTGFRMAQVKNYPDILKDVWVFGTSKGDAQDYLNNYYKIHDWAYPYEYSLNAHNEYIQLWLEFGLLGFLLFVFIVVVPFSFVKDRYFKIILFCFAITMLFESLLERQAGILLFLTVYCLFTAEYEKIKKHV